MPGRTSDPAYWAGKREDAERRVRIAAKELAKKTTPNGHARKTPAYRAALTELLLATRGYEGTLSATPRQFRPAR